VPLLAILNASSLLAFVTWFGAAGYLALRFGGWSLPLALAAAVVAGLAGAVLLGAFLNKVTAGEQVLDSRAFRLEGTLARVTVSVPARGAGEVVFSKEGRTRSEAARSITGDPIPRGTEVVILRYERGVAHVQPWDQLLEERPPPRLTGATGATQSHP
jgi:membrane protein implicated in regulation of membrane protease activity